MKLNTGHTTVNGMKQVFFTLITCGGVWIWGESDRVNDIAYRGYINIK